ncbi:hypothetical protein FE784_00675 [Paenibacillus hemerocallicola]|uniref:Uncharacterized protein n=1 Tax=Paenibacillus hemerocallicola TaxID=1172614 RepID=A0A5C4TGL7_9BACL|nr:hypothetical protein [Paenibacillus hemerocallicola]TNJ68211.1 hypothetical protein FE784_00675 [Paenibacillus hemerocallicola]
MIEKYPLADEPGKTMVVFSGVAGKVYGHIIKDRTDKAPAKFLFETSKYDSFELLKADYPEAIS